MWIKFNPDSVIVPTMLMFWTDWIELAVTTRDDWSSNIYSPVNGTLLKRVYHKFRFFPNAAGVFATYAYLVDTGAAFAMTTPPKWFHVFAQWDTDAGSLVLKVNGRSLATVVYSGANVDPYHNHKGPPFAVPWGYPTDDEGGPNTTQFFSNTNYNEIAVGFSLAEFWLDVDKPAMAPTVTVDKFVDLTTGEPRPLGKDGELPSGKKPAFFFSRTGAPKTFIDNRGYGGKFTFARGYVDPGTLFFHSVDIVGDAIDKDPPLDEPDNPKFEPIPPDRVPASLVA